MVSSSLPDRVRAREGVKGLLYRRDSAAGAAGVKNREGVVMI